MAARIPADAQTGLTLNAHIFNSTGQRWNGTAFETYNASNWATYNVALTEQGASGHYSGSFPSGISAGRYFYKVYVGTTVTDEHVDRGSIDFDGTSEVTFPNNFSAMSIDSTGKVAISNTITVKKNTAISNFMFVMFDSSDHLTPKTGLTITAQRSIDGAAFASCTNAAAEIGSGWYSITLAAADLNGDTIALRFSASGADPTNISIVTNT